MIDDPREAPITNRSPPGMKTHHRWRNFQPSTCNLQLLTFNSYFRNHSGRIGNPRTRTPVAWKMALAMAGAVPIITGSAKFFAP